MPKEFRLGLFVIATLAILVAGTFLIGTNESIFGSSYVVKADFQNVAGLNDGSEVRVGGLHEGTVKSITLPKRADEKVTVVMDLKKETRNIVKQDSVASIKSEGLLGDKYVEISFGSDGAKQLKSGDTIAAQAPLDISDLMEKTNQILDSTGVAMRNIDTTSSNLASISSKINGGKGTVGALINDKAIYNQAEAGVTSFSDDMQALKHNFLLRGFFKNRGYDDTDELAKYAIPRLPAASPVQTFNYDPRRIFTKSDSARLKDSKRLNAAGRFLESQPFGLAVITASMGMKGDTDQDREISEARADAVRNYLVQKFPLDDTKLKILGLGKTAQDSEEGFVKIVIYAEGADKTAVR